MFSSPTGKAQRRRIAPINSNGSILYDTSNQANVSPYLTWNSTNNILTVGNNTALGSPSVQASTLMIGNSTVNSTLNSTGQGYGGTSYIDVVPSMSITTTAFTGVSATTAQNVFASGQRVVTLAGSTTYLIEGEYKWTYSNATNCNVSVLFGNSAAITAIAYRATFYANGIGNVTASAPFSVWAVSNAATLASTANLATTNNGGVSIKGWIETSGAVNITPQFQTGAATGNAPVFAPGTYILFRPVGNATINATGTWA